MNSIKTAILRLECVLRLEDWKNSIGISDDELLATMKLQNQMLTDAKEHLESEITKRNYDYIRMETIIATEKI